MMLKSGFLWLSEQQRVFDFIKRNRVARRMASRFVAGETLDEAIAAAHRLNRDHIGASLDLLGESVTDPADAVASRDEVLAILNRLHETDGDTNVSIKLTQMGLDLDDELCYRNLRTLLTRAGELDVFVRIDMEGSDYTERTLRLFYDRLHPEFGNRVGVVIQSYLHRSAQDIDDLIALGARVRLCKGAYSEPERIAFQSREDVSRSFDELMQRLILEGNYPGIATHDERLIARTIAWVEAHNVPADRFEFQMLYGVRRDLQRSLRARGFNMRVYVPFGTQWYPYLMRRLAERPANVMFMTMSMLKETFSRS